MDIQENERGFSVSSFTDAAGHRCSIQDSSLATEACIWFGVDTMSDGWEGRRMHLTQGMATQVAATLHRIATLDANSDQHEQSATFEDRYGCTCTVSSIGPVEGAIARVGVTMARDGSSSAPMHLTARQIEEVMVPLLAFIDNGTISIPARRTIEQVMEPRQTSVLDVKIPPSMLSRVDVGETGITPQELIDALCAVLEGSGDYREIVGHDAAVQLKRVHQGVRRLWRDPDGELAVL